MVSPGETPREFFDRCMAEGTHFRDVELVLERPPEHWTIEDNLTFTKLVLVRLLQWQRGPR